MKSTRLPFLLFLSFVFCCLLAPLFTSIAFAQSPAEGHLQTSEKVEALPLNIEAITRLKVAGTEIEPAPMRVGNLDILAPIVDQLPSLGATATRAAESNIPDLSAMPEKERPGKNQFFQLNFPEGTDAPPLVFAVGRSVAYIEKEQYPLRAAPLVIKGKLWLPIFSIAPLLGASPRLDASGTLNLNPTIQSVELFEVKGTLAVTIKASAPVPSGKVLMGTLENPHKIYFDFPGYSMGFDAGNTTAERTIAGGLREVERVRAGLFQGFPDTTRVVLDLDQKLEAAIQPLPDKTIAAFLLFNRNRRPPPVGPTNPDDPKTSNELRGVKIVVDAGHGGHDSGATGASSREKDHALDISKRLRTHLLNLGATVFMTREDDRFIPLQRRVDFAHTRDADIFFSVHINSFRSTSAGTQTFYYSAKSKALATQIQKELVKATGLPNRGISSARFLVIRNTRMPSVLTETAFISNPREEKLLKDPKFREKVARGMAQGIRNYVKLYGR